MLKKGSVLGGLNAMILLAPFLGEVYSQDRTTPKDFDLGIADFSGASLACIQSQPFNFWVNYNHGIDRICHIAEFTISWKGGTFAPTTQNKSDDPSIGKFDPACAQNCFFFGDRSSKHGDTFSSVVGGGILNIAPGTYTITGAFNRSSPCGDPATERVNMNIVAGFPFDSGCPRSSMNPSDPEFTGIWIFGDSFAGKAIVPDLGQTTKITKESGDPQTGLVDNFLPNPLVVKVAMDGQTKKDIPVSFEVLSTPAGGENASLSRTGATTDSKGLASTELKLGSAKGTYKVKATCADCKDGSVVTFENLLAKTTEEATILEELFCDGTFFVGEEVPYDLRVRARNTITGSVVDDLEVQFRLAGSPGGEGEVLSSSDTTRNGLARTRLKLGSGKGVYEIEASCERCGANKIIRCPVEAVDPPHVRRDEEAAEFFCCAPPNFGQVIC